MLAERAARNAAQVEAAYGGDCVDDEETPESDPEEDKVQEEYENEEQVATVTVVEDFDIDALIHAGPLSERPNPSLSSNRDQEQTRPPEFKKSRSTTANNTSATSKKKASSVKKIKYETKAARFSEKKKQYARKLEKAARAGGRQSRFSKKRK